MGRICVLLILLILIVPAYGAKKPLPTLITHWENSSMQYKIKKKYFRQEAFSSWDKNFFDQHLLPKTTINYRNSSGSVPGSCLSNLIEGLVKELRESKDNFQDFTLLKGIEFNKKQFAGCIVLKFKDHPFILKLFVENPYSFLHPENKGFRHGCMAVISGGINRFLAGFNRIKNLEITQNLLQQKKQPITIDFPRKWFWKPENSRWFFVKGIDFKESFTLRLPEMYGIVSDEIVSDASIHHIHKHYGSQIFKICKSIDFRLDPNIKNYRLEKKTNTLVAIDTEYFPELLGVKHKIDSDNYFFLHLRIGYKVVRDRFFL